MARRILSLWFPRLAAERLIGLGRAPEDVALAVVAEDARHRVLAALTAEAEAAGLSCGQALGDARAMCPALVTRPADPGGEAAFLSALRRWAGRFSPWVAEEAPAGLVLDITGCAHLFGGEEAMLAAATADCAGHGLSVRAGLADTVGAAWALARYANGAGDPARSGDAIEQEARATRARAARRRPRRAAGAHPATYARTAAPGHMAAALSGLPVAALRLPPETVEGLTRLGLRRIGDLVGQPRAGLARRFGRRLVERLDQALGAAPEPVSPAAAALHFAARLTLPEPIGHEDDVLAGIDRLLPALCARLAAAGRGARRLRLEATRTDHGLARLEVGLARPSAAPERLRPLLALRTGEIEAGFGIERLRLEAAATEPLAERQHAGPLAAGGSAAPGTNAATDLAALIDRLGARLGMAGVTRHHPADTHIPEKTAQIRAAAWSEPCGPWPAPPTPRPLVMLGPEPVTGPAGPAPPARFRWRRRDFTPHTATGPERIAPEWWLDAPAWRSGVRDYWRVETTDGARLWLAYAHGADIAGGWLCHGSFA